MFPKSKFIYFSFSFRSLTDDTFLTGIKEADINNDFFEEKYSTRTI